MWNVVRSTTGNVVEDQMVELMLEYTSYLILWQLTQELWVILHFKDATTRIDPDTSSWNPWVSNLLYLTAKCCKEGFLLQ
jgi:hypothetical protein